MKKFLALTLALVMSLSLVACGDKKTDDTKTDEPDQKTEHPAENEGAYKVAMITDYGDITDQSFNQTTYEACKAFAEDNDIEFNYFKPVGDNTADRVAMIEKAADEGYNVIVMPGYAFGGAIVEAAPEFPDVKFIALDVAAGDLLETAVAKAGKTYDYTPDNWDLSEYVDMSNVYCAVYQEELCGYMAGYAAVKLGYKQLGFLGGMAVPAVVRYGYGFVQGVNAAATELNIADQVSVKYVYGNKFAPAPEITAVMDTWYKGGTEVVFACGGGIYASAAEAAAKVEGAKVIGVDVDQAGIIDGAYGDGMTVTSAMKGLAPTVKTVLAAISADKWADFGGKIETLGLVSDNPDDNYVQLAGSTQFADGFTQDDYKTLVASMFKGDIKVDNSTEKMPEVSVKVETFDNIL